MVGFYSSSMQKDVGCEIDAQKAVRFCTYCWHNHLISLTDTTEEYKEVCFHDDSFGQKESMLLPIIRKHFTPHCSKAQLL